MRYCTSEPEKGGACHDFAVRRKHRRRRIAGEGKGAAHGRDKGGCRRIRKEVVVPTSPQREGACDAPPFDKGERVLLLRENIEKGNGLPWGKHRRRSFRLSDDP